jgi:hypothetical protein
VALVCSLKHSPAPSSSALMKVMADMFQAINDIGFSVPAQGGTYWNGEAMQTKDYNDLDEVPGSIADATAASARNAAHLAGVLRGAQYPPYQ